MRQGQPPGGLGRRQRGVVAAGEDAVQQALGLGGAAGPAQHPGGQHRQPPGRLRLVGHRLAGEALGVARAAGDIGDQGGMQGVQRPQPVGLDQRAERRQRLVRLAAAELDPGQQRRLQHLHRAAAGGGAQPLLGPLPAAGLHVGPGQQQVGGRVVAEAPGQPHRIRPAVQQGGEEGAVQHLRLVRVGAERGQQVVGGGAGVGLGGGEAAREVAAEGAHAGLAQDDARRAVPPGGTRCTAGAAGGQEGGCQEDEPERGAGELHPTEATAECRAAISPRCTPGPALRRRGRDILVRTGSGMLGCRNHGYCEGVNHARTLPAPPRPGAGHGRRAPGRAPRRGRAGAGAEPIQPGEQHRPDHRAGLRLALPRLRLGPRRAGPGGAAAGAERLDRAAAVRLRARHQGGLPGRAGGGAAAGECLQPLPRGLGRHARRGRRPELPNSSTPPAWW